jgi:hypothetical protein
MTEQEVSTVHPGLEALPQRHLLDVILGSRRPSEGPREPLSELEEALLIALTGCTGVLGPDRAPGTHFFLINDDGSYFLRTLPPVGDGGSPFDPEALIARARLAKVRLLDHRVDVPDGNRDFPAYQDANRARSNRPGTTVIFPVVDLSQQYITGLISLLTQPDGSRPTVLDDRNFYRPAGVRKWVRNGFLNRDLRLPLGLIGSQRSRVEADLLLQNLILGAEAMGVGAEIQEAMSAPVLLGDPRYRATYGRMLDFDWDVPAWKPADLLRWQLPRPSLARLRANPIGLRRGAEHLIKAVTPPNYDTMSDAVDAAVAARFGRNSVHRDDSVIECVRDICSYIYRTHGRFPAHCDAIQVPGVWLQAHHVAEDYY